jgi:hypothetical protein
LFKRKAAYENAIKTSRIVTSGYRQSRIPDNLLSQKRTRIETHGRLEELSKATFANENSCFDDIEKLEDMM